MQKLLQNKLGIKFFIIGALVVLLLIPIVMIKSLIFDREGMQNKVEKDIARSSSGVQTVTGPFVAVEYREVSVVEGKSTERVRTKYIVPESFYANADLRTHEKYRGIYKALLYRSNNEITGHFDFAAMKDIPRDKIDKITLALGISDVRGIGLGSKISLSGNDYPIAPGTRVKGLKDGIHVALSLDDIDVEQPLDYAVSFELQGMKDLYFVPIGKESSVELKADWPHPSFVGDFLPYESDISETGHAARWQTNRFSTNMASAFDACNTHFNCGQDAVRKLGVSLIEPVDHYLKSHRAVNYAILIILMVFATFFLLEILQAKPIHPIQYGFVGLALAVFYLLLLSLSEHMGFALAYVISAMASVSLLAIYVSGMLKSNRSGGICFVSLSVMYGAIYGLLSAEDYALLMGSLLCFSVLGLTMYLTRKVDWYGNKQALSEQ